MGELEYRVSALHVNHGLRGDESEGDARFCRDVLGAEIVDLEGAGLTVSRIHGASSRLAGHSGLNSRKS